MRKIINFWIFLLLFLCVCLSLQAQTVQPYILFRPVICDGALSASGSFQVKVLNSGGDPANWSNPSFTTHWYLQKNSLTVQSGDFQGQAYTINFSGISYSLSDDIRFYAVGTDINTAPSNFDFVQINAVNTPSKPSINPSATKICGAESVTLNAIGGGNLYTWSNASTGSPITVGVGTYTVHESNVCGTSPESDPVTISTLAIPPKPTITLPALPLCNGATGTLTANGLGGTYTWSTGATGSMVSVTSAGSYTVNETNYCGTSPNSDPVTVTTSLTPTAPAVSNSAGTLLCDGASTTLSTSPSYGGTVHWSTGATGNSISVSVAGSYYAYEINSCGTGTNSSSVTISTNSTPSAPTISPVGPIILCDGNATTLTSSGSGTINWFVNGSPYGAVGNNLSVNSAGSYTSKVTNVCATSAAGNAVVINTNNTPPAPSLNVTGSITLCDGAGQLFTATPSTSGGVIHWSTGATGNSITVYAAGTYFAYESNASCGNGPNSATVTITTLSKPMAPFITPSGNQLLCNGASVTVSSTGGNIFWSNGTTGNTLVSTLAGTYYTYDKNYCGNSPNSNSVIISTVTCPTPTPGASFLICPGAQKTLDAGTGYDTYLWSNGQTTRTIAAGPGIYTVTVSKSGCYATSSAVIVSYYAVTTPAITVSGPTTFCSGGSVTLNASIGTAYLWSNGGTGNTLSVNTSGGYYVTVTDVNGCQATSAATIVTVNPLPSASIAGSATVCQNSASPAITFNGTGGTAPYTFTYRINGGSNQTVTTTSGSSVTVNVSANTPGSYTLSLVSVQESSSTSCINTTSGSATVVINPLPTASVSGSTTVCQNSTNPSITFTGSGGTAPYTFIYKINGGSNQTVTTTSGSSVTVSVPTNAPGVYTYSLVSVQESSSTSCVNAVSSSAIAVINPLPSATISGNTSVCQNSTSPAITFTGSGGTAPYTFTYRINGGSNQTVTTTSGNSITVSVPTSAAGAYTYSLVSVQESSSTSCINAVSGSATVVVNPLPSATIAGSTTICLNSTAPVITFTGNNATAPYTFTYKINGGTNQTVTTTNGSGVTVSVPTTTPGTYTYSLVSVQESSSTSCINAASGSAVTVVNPLPSATIAGSTTICQNSIAPVITFTGNNATAPYTFTYKINGGTNQTATTTNGSSVTVSVPTTTPGTYTYSLVSVQESSSTACINAATGSTIVVVNPLPSATITGSTTVCQNSTNPLIIFTGSGGTAPYTLTYKINGGANQTITTTSGNSVSVIIPTGTPGTFVYSLVNVQESSNTLCNNAASGSATVVVNPLPSATIGGSTAVCQNSSSPVISFTGNNGTAPYTFTYKINGGANQTVTTTSSNSVTVSVPTGTPGTYTYSLVSVQESGSTGCINAASGNANVVVNPLPSVTIAGSMTVCQSSTAPLITFTGSNGTAPYTFTYRINGGANQIVTTISGNSVTISVPAGTPGTYVYSLVSVQESSSTACNNAAIGSATVVVNPLPSATITGSTTLCQNSTSPLITFTGSNATAPYMFTYKINGGANKTVTTTSGNSVTVSVPTATPGTYTYSLVSIQESSITACINSVAASATVIVDQLATASITGTTTVCQSSANPLITFTATDGVAPYTFTYQLNGGPNQTISTTSGNSVTLSVPTGTPGTYTYSLVSIKESSITACVNSATGSSTIKVNPLPAAAVLVAPDNHLCNGSNDQITIYNYTPGFTYTWYKDGALLKTSILDTIMNNQAGSFTAMVTSDKGCDAAAMSNTIIISTGTISTPVITGYKKVCTDGKTRLLVIPKDSTRQYEVYRWTDTPLGDIVSRDSIFSAPAGQYQVLVKREGCYDSANVTITADDTEFPAGQLKINPTNIQYGEQAVILADVTLAVKYKWDLGDGNTANTITNKILQNYYVAGDSIRVQVWAISQRNCITKFTATIKVNPQAAIIVPDLSRTGNLKNWNVFPTPFRSQLKVSLVLKKNESVKIDLFTADGMWIRTWSFPGKKGENLFHLDKLEGLAANVTYLVTGIYNGEKHFDKVYKY
ncbi:MAG: hypothetical protein M0Q26_14300 [Chitinophagaceae bacterium]|nr:hypothetical protein [Chitinophagaceae bacterium]